MSPPQIPARGHAAQHRQVMLCWWTLAAHSLTHSLTRSIPFCSSSRSPHASPPYVRLRCDADPARSVGGLPTRRMSFRRLALRSRWHRCRAGRWERVSERTNERTFRSEYAGEEKREGGEIGVSGRLEGAPERLLFKRTWVDSGRRSAWLDEARSRGLGWGLRSRMVTSWRVLRGNLERDREGSGWEIEARETTEYRDTREREREREKKRARWRDGLGLWKSDYV